MGQVLADRHCLGVHTRVSKTFQLKKRGAGNPVLPLQNQYTALETRQLLSANVVLEWNELLLNAIRVDRSSPPVASRALAIVHTSIYDAVNSIDGRFHEYHVLAPVHAKASLEAAVAAAAERALSALFPAQSATFTAALNATLDKVPNGIREDQGVAVGRFVADKILAWRANDGHDLVVPYEPGHEPGEWRPTPPGFFPTLLPQWPLVKPWSMTSGSQFRPAGPPALSSAKYAADFNEVREIGDVNSTTRTPVQTEIALIWAGGPGTSTPPGQWNLIAQEVVRNQQTSLADTARLFAILNIALADAAISSWDAKYWFNLWRPITAIREADTDGNPATVQDPDWTPLITTPPFSSYTSGHSTFSGAASTVLTRFFGTDALPFSLKSEVSGVPDRHFTSFRSAAEEAGMSRIYGGIHFMFDNVDALEAGRALAHHAFNRHIRQRTVATALRDGGLLYINGTNLGDRIFVNRQGSHIVVRHNGLLIGKFEMAGMHRLVCNGGNGDDFLLVTPAVTIKTELYGGRGVDCMFGGRGWNWMYGEGGNDVIFGGKNQDIIRGGGGNDRLFGLAGSDQLFGQGGRNKLWGGRGNDTLHGTKERDKLFGGGGIDHYLWM